MNVRNIHERALRASAPTGALIDSLASEEDALWPVQAWPRMVLDRPLGPEAAGGHGPIRYVVEAYQPGRSIRFRFTGPKGFDGWHGYEIVSGDRESTILRHTLEMTTRGLAILSWPLIYRPLHDALIEDSLARAQAASGDAPTIRPWSPWVRLLRWAMSRGRAGPQVPPTKAVATRA